MSVEENKTYVVRPLGDSLFNYKDLFDLRFVHYCRICRMALKTKAKNILEIGPGDHLVTDFLRRKGLRVDTMDNDPMLYPDYQRDIRHPWEIDKKYECIVAAEVFEHLPFKYLDAITHEAWKHIEAGGWFIVSLPHSTIRLFPKDKRYGKIQSPMGRLPIGIPFYRVQKLISFFRGIYRFFFLRYTWKGSFRPYILHPPEDETDGSVHHWDTGYNPTNKKQVCRIFKKYFDIIEEETDRMKLNVFYLTMKRRDEIID